MNEISSGSVVARSLVVVLVAFLWTAFYEKASAGARIYRDEAGVPHIYADSNEELFHAYGYLLGQERMFQIEARKRQAYGRTAEVFGPGDSRWREKYIEKDIAARRALNLDDLRSQLENLGSSDRAILTAMATGLNRAIEEVLENKEERLAKPFVHYGFLPEPWTELDILVTATDVLAYYSNFAFQLDNLSLYLDLAQSNPEHCDDIFDQLLWLHDPAAVTSAGDELAEDEAFLRPEPKGCSLLSSAPNGIVVNPSLKLSDLSAVGSDVVEPRRASMAWAVGRDRAEGARAIFLSGPQTGWHRPSYYYTVGLHGGDFDFVGMAPEGMLPFEVGVSRHYAWGMTAGLAMQSDIFQLRRHDDGDRYLHNGDWRAFQQRNEQISVKGQEDRIVTIRSSSHGPVIHEDAANDLAYAHALSWRGFEAQSIFAWLRAASAASFGEWRDRSQQFAFNYNWFYAGADGNVGFAFTGLFPQRKEGQDIRLPVSGSGDWDYKGPAVPLGLVKRSRAAVYNFNNRPALEMPNSGLYWEQWTRGNQVEIIKREFARRGDRLNWDDIWDINRVVSFTDVNWNILRDFIALAADGMDTESDAGKAAQLILDWNGLRIDENGDGKFDHAGLTFFDAWLPIMVAKTLQPTIGDSPAGGYYVRYVHQPQPPRLEEHPSGGVLVTYRALLAATGHPVPASYDFFKGQDPLDLVRASLAEAVEGSKDRFTGKPLEQWLKNAPVQRFFATNANRIPMAAPGDIDSGIFANRGGINLQVQYGTEGDLERAAFVNPLGGAEDRDDRKSAYHLDLYAAFQLAPLTLARESELQEKGEPFIILD